jgi:magnesium chelatase subunit I
MNKETTLLEFTVMKNSVIPELERAILSSHNINLLGLRGQAKKQLW